MVGNACLQELVQVASVAKVLVLGRRPPSLSHPHLQVHQVEFAALHTQPTPGAQLTAALCALGTTMKKAKSEAAFRAVDHDAVVSFARWARQHGCPTFVLVSSLGADPRSRSFYLRVKAEAERAIETLGFARVIVLRPGLLLGSREESRPAEAIARAVMPLLGKLLVGNLDRYRGVDAHTVAKAMATAALDSQLGLQVWENREILHYAQRR